MYMVLVFFSFRFQKFNVSSHCLDAHLVENPKKKPSIIELLIPGRPFRKLSTYMMGYDNGMFLN